MRAGKKASIDMLEALRRLALDGPQLRGGRGPERIHERTADALRAKGLVIYKRGGAATWNRAYYETKIVITPAGRELLEAAEREAGERGLLLRTSTIVDRLISQAKKGT